MGWTVSLISALLLCLAAATSQAAGRSLVFTPLPIEQPETVIAASRPLVTYLSQKMGVPISIRHEKSYADILRLFQEGKIDLLHLGPLPYVTLRQACPKAVPLAAINESNAKAAYTCAMVTTYDGPKTIKQVRGPVALTQPLSTCGHLTAGYLLDKHGIQLESLRHDHVGTHDKVALEVIKGRYQVGTIKTSVAKKYTGMALRVIEETPYFPGFLLVGNSATLRPEQLEQITRLLLTLPVNNQSSPSLGKYGFTATSDADYDLIRTYTRFFR